MSRRSRRAVLAFALALLAASSQPLRAADGPNRAVVLDEAAYLRQHYCFGPDHVSATLLRSDGEKILGAAAIRKLKDDTEARMRHAGLDPAKVPWQDHAAVRLFFDSPRECLTPPPNDWTAAAFDDSNWVLERGPILAASAPHRRLPQGLGWTADDLDQADFDTLGIRSCRYRARFVVDDPARAAGMTLRLVFRGGARVLVNGQELARAYLPNGELSPDTPGDDYPQAAYQDKPQLRDRAIGPVMIPAGSLRKRTNVLAVEIRASQFHPFVLSMKLPVHNHKVRRGMEGLWPHAQLAKLELTAEQGSVASALSRPTGPHVWVQDVHHRVESTEFLCPGENPGTVRFVAVRNGTFAAQIVVAAGSRVPLHELQVTPMQLERQGGPDRLPASAIHVFYPAPYPLDEFREERLGDERGLGAAFPDQTLLTRREAAVDPAQPALFDHLAEKPTPNIPAATCRPVWLSLRVPPDAVPGHYRGSIRVKADGLPLIELPVEADILGWRLPNPADFQTFAACEENPYGVAKQYGARLWSDEHFKLLEVSFAQLARAGSRWLNIPVILHTEFGNGDDSMVTWTRRKDGALTLDHTILDRYLDTAARLCGPPRVINFIVMQAMASASAPPTPPAVNVFDEATGRSAPLALGARGAPKDEKRRAWGPVARALFDHMKSRGQTAAMFWGYPSDQEDDRDLKLVLAEFAPNVFWAANPHEILWNSMYVSDSRYRAIVTVRYQPGARSFAAFRTDRGWKSQFIHLLSPRVGGNYFTLHTVSHPFAYRALPEQALAHGHSGFGRLGADEWAAVHYSGMERPRWLVGMPVLFLLWPGARGAESSIRFDTLIEGIQETEARIFLERALDGGRLPPDLAARVKRILAARLDETSFSPPNLCVHELEKYHYRWQNRSRELYQAAEQGACHLAAP